MIYSLILFILYSMMEGYFRCGEYWFMRKELLDEHNPNKFKLYEDPHPYWFIQRAFVGAIASYKVFEYNVWYGIAYLIGLGLLFPLLHDGFYYVKRHQLNNRNYPKGFFDGSTTSKAKMTIKNVWVRFGLFLLGLLINLLIINAL